MRHFLLFLIPNRAPHGVTPRSQYSRLPAPPHPPLIITPHLGARLRSRFAVGADCYDLSAFAGVRLSGPNVETPGESTKRLIEIMGYHANLAAAAPTIPVF